MAPGAIETATKREDKRSENSGRSLSSDTPKAALIFDVQRDRKHGSAVADSGFPRSGAENLSYGTYQAPVLCNRHLALEAEVCPLAPSSHHPVPQNVDFPHLPLPQDTLNLQLYPLHLLLRSPDHRSQPFRTAALNGFQQSLQACCDCRSWRPPTASSWRSRAHGADAGLPSVEQKHASVLACFPLH